jgi:hypothetical protein
MTFTAPQESRAGLAYPTRPPPIQSALYEGVKRSSPEFGIAIAVVPQRTINFGRRSLLRSASFRLRKNYGGQDGGQASQNSTLQNSLAALNH